MAKASHIAFFISSHGLGHAARAAGVMGAIHECNPDIHFDIFTTVPEWFFKESLQGPFAVHSALTDIGLVQKNPFCEDIERSLKHLDRFFPLDMKRLEPIMKIVSDSECDLILCDISPMGIDVGKQLNIPSVLIENFTWDWIYESYAFLDNRINSHIGYLNRLFDTADIHIQAEPVCNPKAADLTVSPVCRKPRTSAKEIRSELGVPESAPVVTITMGGIPKTYRLESILEKQSDIYFVISGGGDEHIRNDHVTILPYHSDFYHPDLIHASDIVVGKSGYSTLAEVFYSGVPFIFVNRPLFREAKVLEPYIREQMNGVGISEAEFDDGSWLNLLPDLLEHTPIARNLSKGANQAAEYILGLL